MKKIKISYLIILVLSNVFSYNLMKEKNSDTIIRKEKFFPQRPQRNKSEIEILRKGLIIDNVKTPFFSAKENKIVEKKSKISMRNLLDLQEFKDIGFISLPQENNVHMTNAYRYILSNLKRYKSQFIYYPYKFNYSQEGNLVLVDNGGVFNLNQTTFPPSYSSDYFNYIKNISSINISRAKALYDINIAILSMEYEIDSIKTNLFYESEQYCGYFVQRLGKIPTCLFSMKDFESFQTNYTSKGAVVLFNDTELLKENSLYDEKTNINKFDLLIVPDHIFGVDSIIMNKLTNEGIEKIKKFASNGGNILASGKSGYLLQLWGIIDPVYNKEKYLTSIDEKSLIDIKGCEGTSSISPENPNDNFLLQFICLGTQTQSFLTSSYLMTDTTGFDILMKIDKNSNGLKYKSGGVEENLSGNENDFPFVLTKEYNSNSRIWIVNGQAFTNSDYASFMMNIFFHSMSKNAIFEYNFKMGNGDEDLPIPGGEEGVQLTIFFKFYNVFSNEISNFNLDILLPDKVIFTDYSMSGCEIKDNYPKSIESMNLNKYLHCNKNLINKLEKIEIEFNIEIQSAEVTQKKTGIPLIYPILNYHDNETNKDVNLESGPLLVDTQLAALLRATFNPDPSGTYPIPGIGWFTDNVLNVENKEGTIASHVNFISIVPLISPVVDGSDEGATAKLIEIYDHYYDDHKYKFPFVETGGSDDYDYLDFSELSGKDTVSVIDWDTPVRISKVMKSDLPTEEVSKHNITIDDKFMTSEDIKVLGSNLLTNTNSEMMLKEIYFSDSDLFYEHAYQRQLIFIDTAKVEGAKAQYDSDLLKCRTQRDPHRDNVCKYDIPWTRVDIYFYKSNELQQPKGMDDKVLLSIDKYPKPTENLADTLGEAKPYLTFNGHFNSNLSEKLVPNQYSNVLLQNKAFTTYDPTNNEDMNRINDISNGTIKLTHYLVPVKDEDLKYADSVYNFQVDEVPGDNDVRKGYNIEYPNLRFIDGHTIKIKLLPEQTRAGGRITLKIPNGYKFKGNDPINNENIMISADNVAFFKTLYEPNSNYIILYFRRGLMPNEAYGKPSMCEIYLENLQYSNGSDIRDYDFDIEIILEELKYNLNAKETQFETYTQVTYKDTINNSEYINKLRAVYSFYWSLPALYIENTMKRDQLSTIKEYELLNPYCRYGLYFQELLLHRTVWGQGECHHVSDPGLQSSSSGFSLLSAVGISFIPFADYVTHGSALMIPGAVSTTRIEWNDVWGRKWVQPIRSLYPDIPPVPSPLMNFMMSTTFELLSKDGKERLLEWPSDEEAVIRVQMKFLNNYFKFFLPSICLKNQYPYEMEKITHFDRDRTHINYYDDNHLTPDYTLANSDLGNDHQVSLGQSSVYGVCYQGEGSFLSGTKITSDISSEMKYAMSCANTNDVDKIKQCVQRLKELALPLLKHRPDDDAKDDTPNHTYNYSPDVDSYYPKGYINEKIMWDLTKKDYEDNAFSKGYVWHMDNNLPAIDVGPPQNPAYYKPHNFVAFPIFKGSGYQIEYNKEFGLSNKFGVYKGWWSDNLQNKDKTLLAGQEKNNEVSVDKVEDDLLKESDWISSKELNNSLKGQDVINERLKNIYVCLFNQHRVRITPYQSIFSYPNNVYQNNIIPIIPELDSDSAEYTNYDCTNKYQYSPQNISQVDNIVYTSTNRDWLYFAVNLRGEALENINVLMTLKPYSDRKYEGETKVQDGGRFTYWNPANGPNSFLYVDNVVNLVYGTRVDYEIVSKIYPNTINTFNIVSYQLHSIEDKEEYLREYKLSIYDNSYGFGDSTVLVYVGGTKDSSCKVNAGETTYVKIVFYNNAGFDWNMKQNAIEFTKQGQQVVSAFELMKNIIRTILVPTKYNFLKLTVPEEIKNYITIVPSDHNADIAPHFFDFQNINVVSIRDGFEGSYYYKIKIHNDFPDKYKGKLWSIKVDIVESYFDKLPGYNDPTKTGFHDYKLKIPDIKFGVPYSSGDFKGKVFYTLGRGKNLKLKYELLKSLQVDGIKLISEEDVLKLREVDSEDNQNIKETKTLNIWENAKSPKNGTITYTLTECDNNYNYLNIDLSNIVPELPYENEGVPDTTKIYVLTKTSASQLEYGTQFILRYSFIQYNDGRKNKENAYWIPAYASVKGPWMYLDADYYVAFKNENTGLYEKASDQEIYENDMGIIMVNITAKNKGSSTAYQSDFLLYVPKEITIDKEELKKNGVNAEIKEEEKENILIIKSGRNIASQELYIQQLYLGFGDITLLNQNRRNLNEIKNKKSLIKKIEISMCPTESCTQKQFVKQSIPIEIYTKVSEGSRGNIELDISSKGTFELPKYKLSAKPDENNLDSQYMFYRKINDNEWEKISNKSNINEIEDSPLISDEIKSLGKYTIHYKVEGYSNERIFAGDGISVEETLKKKKNKNLLSIIFIILGSILFILIIFCLIFCLCRNDKEEEEKKKIDEKKKFEHNHLKIKKTDKIRDRSSASSRSMLNKNDIKIIKYITNQN